MSIEDPTAAQIVDAVRRGRPIEKLRDAEGRVTGLRIVELAGSQERRDGSVHLWFGDGVARHLLDGMGP